MESILIEEQPSLKSGKYFLSGPSGSTHPIFETFADAVSNRYLKDIIKVKEVAIHKNITYHTARHTAATLMVEGGHLTETQQMLGHGDIKTTMGYVHTSTKNLIDAKKQRFG